MRYGFTTGSCAAAAAKAATYMLLSGLLKEEITIETPKGIQYQADIRDIYRTEREVRCAVQKDGGEDPDITTGAYIYATVSYGTSEEQESALIEIYGGEGIGIVTKPGLDQPVGEVAINRVPRAMIRKEVEEVCRLFDYRGTIQVTVSVPDGVQLAKQTFNPRLGIVGGISILGTSGIVEPMSSQAILETIRVELRQRRALGERNVILSPGNYGQEFMKKQYGYDLDRSVKCSNFIGQTIDFSVEEGFESILLVGHIGKLIKVAGGIMNTHSREADARMEILAACALEEQVAPDIVCRLLHCTTTEEAVSQLRDSRQCHAVFQRVVDRICYYLTKRSNGNLKVDCLLYTNEFGELARSKEVDRWFIS